MKFQRIMVEIKNTYNIYTYITINLTNNCTWWLNDTEYNTIQIQNKPTVPLFALMYCRLTDLRPSAEGL
jgi:hypothetical protein